MSKQWSVSRHGWILRLTVIRALSFSVHQQCLPLEWLYSWADHLLHTMVPGSSRVISSLHLMALSKCSPLTSVLHKDSGSDLSHGHFWTSHNVQATGIIYPPRVRWLTASFGRGMVATRKILLSEKGRWNKGRWSQGIAIWFVLYIFYI